MDQDELFNVKMIIKGQGKGRRLLFNGHIDHVPVGDMVGSYSGRLMDGNALGINDQVVYGRETRHESCCGCGDHGRRDNKRIRC